MEAEIHELSAAESACQSASVGGAQDEWAQQWSDEEELDDLAEFQRKVFNHPISWPAQTMLDMEDHLSRSYDILVFLFFEQRDRAHSQTKDDMKYTGQLDIIPECPSKIVADRARSAMRSRRV
jgi:hypothetical protein